MIPTPPSATQAAIDHHQAGRLDEAEEIYRQTLSVDPDNALVSNNLGSILLEREEFYEAEDCFRAALRAQPDLVVALYNLGGVLHRMGRSQEAERYCRQAIELDPRSAAALNNLAAVLEQRGDLPAAEDACRKALLLEPTYVVAHANLGSVLKRRGRMKEAEACYRDALRLAPESVPIKYDLSMLTLLQGNYAEGLKLYETRFQCGGKDFASPRNLYGQLSKFQRWQGEPLSGQRVYVWAEQGLGDTLMVMRFLPMLKARGAREMIVYCKPALERLVRLTEGVDDVITQGPTWPPDTIDVHCSMMSLPYLFDIRLDSIPNHVPYICVPEPLKEQWRDRLSGFERIKVGLTWAGSESLRDDEQRSIPLKQFTPLLKQRHVRLISLQKGEAAKQWRGWSKEGDDLIDLCDDLLDTAGLVANLDLVISVDTSVVHLAGALGKPVWLLNRVGGDWRWGLEGERSPWYPTMKIFRQRQTERWDDVIEQISRELERVVRS